MHASQVDKQGVPYIRHLERVAATVSPQARAIALFHDTLEDRRATQTELARYLTRKELIAVVHLTRDDAEPYAEYIQRLCAAPGMPGIYAREVKRADLADNLGRLTPELEHLRERYELAMARLK